VLHEIITAHLRSLTRIMGEGNVTCLDLDMANVLKEYANSRKPNADAIANMALENFEEVCVCALLLILSFLLLKMLYIINMNYMSVHVCVDKVEKVL
jgi:hypothetical protein